ncbi:VanW family protein [Pseudoneobacillus rhizosphaerae]|jgi:vancomycin resistance protein YoaR|uniref:VanW family protein n=1 Tax=Pseudoneobacillus rhizosphaerae TaxID=2880968 RepID=UPI001E543F33|nr:VanW family protein [Pseudoneobacillus rhizosphaerae]
MKVKKWTVSIIIVVSLIGLIGCSEKTSKEEELEKKIAELEKKVEEEQKEKEEALKRQIEIEEEEQVIMVDVVDPHTKKVIKTINPVEMGYGTDNEKYKAEIESWVTELARGSENRVGYDQRMIPDKIGMNGEIVKGKPRIILEESELVEKVMNASEKGEAVELPLYVFESGYRPEEAAYLSEVVIASYTTHFNSGVAGRSKNIELSAAAINNIILGTNDIFSFNTTVGPSDAAHGYQPAPEILNGKLVDGIGGGICQTSSTLFNAVDKLGVSYIEWHHHSLNVGYVPKGRDATVSYGGLDFRFENTTGIPLLIKAIVHEGSLTVEIRTSKENQTLLAH